MSHEETTKVLHYTVGHEVGVAAGFAGLMLLSALTFLISWRAYNKKEEKREAERKAGLVERGFGVLSPEKGGLREKEKQREEDHSREGARKGDVDGNREVGGGSDGRDFEEVRGEKHASHGFGGDGSGERISARA